MKTMIIFLFAAAFLQNAVAQSTDTRPCPVIILEGPPDNKIPEGKDAVIMVKPFDSAYKDLSPTYKWVLSNGSISSGQGTSRIYVDTKGLREQTITITVELGGMKAGCSNVKSITIDVSAEKEKSNKNNQGKNQVKNG